MSDISKWLAELTPGGAGIWTIVGVIVVALIRQKPITRKLIDQREGNLLKERAADMRGMRRRITELEAEQRVDRHALGNLEQCLDTLLMMIEVNPDRAKEAAAKVRAMRETMKVQLATEKAGLHAATIAAVAADKADDDVAASKEDAK